jgi:curli production assembly/transport component CsgG/holdfast attachment protein HfaB
VKSKTLRAGLALACSLSLGACVANDPTKKVQLAPNQMPVKLSTPVSSNVTPLTPALKCYGAKLSKSPRRGMSVSVGDIRDYTGKQTDSEGFAISQGGALMAYSALGYMAPGVQLHERFDTRIADAELAYSKARQLGDGATHTVEDPTSGKKDEVPWQPYFGGSVLKSDYYIVGGITELNYNIASGGGEAAIGGIGGKKRTYTMNVAVDLRIVGTQSLQVYDTVTVQKQITGKEVGADVYRFFGDELFDFNVGSKDQEPLQLAVRMAIEAATLDLISSVSKVPATDCLSKVVN